jgi:hypothetical protein
LTENISSLGEKEMAGKVIIQGIEGFYARNAKVKIFVDSVQVGTVGQNEPLELPVYQDCVFTCKLGFSSMKEEEGYHAKDNTLAVLQLVNNRVSGKVTFTVLTEEAYSVEEEEKAPVDILTEAKIFAQSVELATLKAPATAKFCSHEEMKVIEQNGVYTVSGYVDSQNSYGAMLRSTFTLHVTKHPAVGWISTDTFVDTESKARSLVALWVVLGTIASIVGAVITYFQIQDLLG